MNSSRFALPSTWALAKPANLRTNQVATLTAAVLLGVGIVLIRLADDRDADAVLVLLVLPIALVAAQLGPAAGLTATAVALALVGIWANPEDVSLGPLGYVVRAVAFLVGVSAGLLVRDRREAAEERLAGRVFEGPPHVFSPPEGDSLSRRELEVLELIARGSTNAQIAARFVISEETVKSHAKHIFQKLVVANRTEAALRYVELYGQPSREDEVDAVTTGSGRRTRSASSRLGAASERSATVGRLSTNDHVVLKLGDGREIKARMPEALRDRLAVGTSALVYFDEEDNVVGWYLPDAGVGVDIH
jgi:DNA-binding CsgD family transcriptional regulator